MRKAGLWLSLVGSCLLLLAFIAPSAEACPSRRWQIYREAQLARQTAIVKQKQACRFGARLIVEGASGFAVGFSLVHLVVFLVRRRRSDDDRG